MVSYFKTQWWRLLCGLMCLIYAVVIICTSIVTDDTVANLSDLLTEVVRIVLWLMASCNWFIISFISYNEDCIKELDKRVKQLETWAITDIDEISKNNLMVRRRLGPDKEEK